MRRLGWFVGLVLLNISANISISPVCWALEKSIDRQGIDAHTLQRPPYNLTDKDIFIGQVELSRPSRCRR